MELDASPGSLPLGIVADRCYRRRYCSHRSSVLNAKPKVDSGCPVSFQNRHKPNPKKTQLQREREEHLNHCNQQLLEKFTRVSEATERIYAKDSFSANLQTLLSRRQLSRRDKRFKSIEHENEKLADRISGRKATYCVDSWMDDRRNKLKYLCNVAIFKDKFREEMSKIGNT